MIRKIVLASATLAFVALIGCGGPPTEEINKAKAAKATADGANAMAYAKDEYDMGVKAWNDGEAAVKAKEWDKAKAAYMLAGKQFDAAAKAAPAGHDAMKTELTARLAKMEEDHAKLEKDKAMKMAMGKMKKEDKMKADNMIKECKDAMAAAKDAMGKDDLMAAKDAMDKDDGIHKDLMAMMPMKKK